MFSRNTMSRRAKSALVGVGLTSIAVLALGMTTTAARVAQPAASPSPPCPSRYVCLYSQNNYQGSRQALLPTNSGRCTRTGMYLSIFNASTQSQRAWGSDNCTGTNVLVGANSGNPTAGGGAASLGGP